jgi:penicillin-binding protein 2
MKNINVVEVTNTSKKVPESVGAQYIGIAVIFTLFLSSFSFLIYVGFTLTIAQGKKYSTLAAENSVGKIAVFGERGMIVDRNGKALVENKKSYDVFVDPDTAQQEELITLFPDKKAKLTEIFNKAPHMNTLFLHDAAKDIIITVKEKAPKGVELRHSYVRHYLFPAQYAHLLGYTGVASEDDLKNDTTVVRNQIVGKSGLEYQYDQELRGEVVYETYEKDAFGNQVSAISTVSPKSGTSLTLTINKKFQDSMYAIVKQTVDKNKARGGSAVVLDIHTGEVITLVSYPSFDPNEFVTGISTASYAKLSQSPQSPLLNRPIAAQEPPGSTFKTVVATAALDTGAITETTTFLAPGVIYLSGGTPFQDYRKRYNGNLTIRDALMVSSNIFFCRTAMKLGIDGLLPYAERYGIGKTTDIDLPGEMRGRLPSPENKIWLAKNGATWLDPVWYPEGDTCNSAIGQGIALATPLQMANIAATIANGGTVYKPFTVRTQTDATGKTRNTTPTIVAKDIASESALQVIREGMRMSVNGSRGVVTALRYVPMKVAAKTGTAEFGIKDKNGYSTAHAWVIGFYPYDEPKYAFAMLIEGGGTSSVASFAMRDFLNAVY